MRLTWLVLGVVVAAGAVAFINTDDAPADLPKAKPEDPALNREESAKKASNAFDLLETEADREAERRAQAFLKQLGEAQAQGGKGAEDILAKLRADEQAWDAESARRHAYLQGQQVAVEAVRERGRAAGIAKKDEARRLLSRGLFLPEMFDKQGHPTADRTRAIEVIQRFNREVMTYEPGVQGVTQPYEWEAGLAPVLVVSRKQLLMGPNALLYWNQGGNLDANRIQAGQLVQLPQEELTIQVSLRHKRLAIFIGDWFVKEWVAGIGAEESPSPIGVFTVHSKQRNPTWTHPKTREDIPWENKERNELGDAWIAIVNAQYPKGAGIGLHGTNKPETIGTRCSRGCIRVRNDHAIELLHWVRRKDSNGGAPTRVFIRP